MTDQWMTVAEVASALGIKPATIMTWRRQGKGPPFIGPRGALKCRKVAFNSWLIEWEREQELEATRRRARRRAVRVYADRCADEVATMSPADHRRPDGSTAPSSQRCYGA